MKNQTQRLSLFTAADIFNFNLQLRGFLSHFFIFGFGLTMGLLCSMNNEILPLDLQLTIFRVPPPPPPSPSSPSLPPPPPVLEEVEVKEKTVDFVHDIDDDEELLWRASMEPKRSGHLNRVPKVAFMFLTKWDLPLAPFWEKFFAGHEGLYSIYIHTNPTYREEFPKNSVFYGRRIPSKIVEWGKINMIEAERRLLASSLLDYSNQWFVLLSEACIPLFNFPTVYDYLMNSTKTFVQVFDDPSGTGRGRYSNQMRPDIRLEQWRKGSQWIQLDRQLAIDIVSDRQYFKIFQKHCKAGCYSDEHYIPTFVHIRFSERNSNRGLTWVDWTYGGPHPTRFIRKDVTIEFLEKLRRGGNCEYNGKNATICFLFARKFLPNSLDRLMRFGPKLMGFSEE